MLNSTNNDGNTSNCPFTDPARITRGLRNQIAKARFAAGRPTISRTILEIRSPIARSAKMSGLFTARLKAGVVTIGLTNWVSRETGTRDGMNAPMSAGETKTLSK